MEDFVRSTRRWYDRGNPRDAGEATPARWLLFIVERVLKPKQLILKRISCDGFILFGLIYKNL